MACFTLALVIDQWSIVDKKIISLRMSQGVVDFKICFTQLLCQVQMECWQCFVFFSLLPLPNTWSHPTQNQDHPSLKNWKHQFSLATVIFGQLELALTWQSNFQARGSKGKVFWQEGPRQSKPGTKITFWATLHCLNHYITSSSQSWNCECSLQSSCHGRLAAHQDKPWTMDIASKALALALTPALALGPECFGVGRHDRLAVGRPSRAAVALVEAGGRRPLHTGLTHRPVPEATAAPYFQQH